MPSQRLTAALALSTIFAAAQCGAPRAMAQEAETRAKAQRLTIATYEVGDLVVTVPDYIAPDGGGRADLSSAGSFGGGGGGGGFGGGGGNFGSPGATPIDAGGNMTMGGQSFADAGPITLPALQQMITRVVHPDSWAVNGGGEGAIEAIGASLVVLNTNEVHELIQTLLRDLRLGSATRRSVAVDARWLLLNSDDLERLSKRDDEDRPTVDRTVLAELTRRPTSLRGFTNCFSGQGVYLISGTRRNVVRSYIPVVGSLEQPEMDLASDAAPSKSPFRFAQYGGGGGNSGRSVGYQPVIETPNFGVLLRIRPTLMQGEDAAVVDLTSTVTVADLDSSAAPDLPAPLVADAPNVDRLAIDTLELATTLRVPLGQPVLVGGMSHITPVAGAAHESTADAAEPSQEMPQLYLVLEVR